jgi:hypothetical protein
VRKIIQIGFVALFAYQLVGFFAFFEIEHYLIRKQIKKAIKLSVPENQLIKFHFTEREFDQLHWVKPHEFRLKGRFYDVVHKSKVNGIWHFHCINDIQETALFATLNTACAENLSNTPASHPMKGWLKVLKEPMEEISNNETIHLAVFQFEQKEEFPNFHCSNYLDPYLASAFPPPDFM